VFDRVLPIVEPGAAGKGEGAEAGHAAPSTAAALGAAPESPASDVDVRPA
jgi:hypothetical protein